MNKNVFVVSLLNGEHLPHKRIEQSLALAHHLPQVPAPINHAGAPWPQRGRAVLDGTPSSIISSFPRRSDTTSPLFFSPSLLCAGLLLMYHLGADTSARKAQWVLFYRAGWTLGRRRLCLGVFLEAEKWLQYLHYYHRPVYPNAPNVRRAFKSRGCRFFL